MDWINSTKRLPVDYTAIRAEYADRLRNEIIEDLVSRGRYKARIGNINIGLSTPIFNEFEAAGFQVSIKARHKQERALMIPNGCTVVIAFEQEPPF